MMAQTTPAPVKPSVTIADLEKLDIRAGTILSVEDVAGSQKLVRLNVSTSGTTRA
jgi:tRNA-binding EMAP/Myf-like protein